ncbi:hypothetical protein BH23GEM10_BH23GEM10_00850 [soil metagenome]
MKPRLLLLSAVALTGILLPVSSAHAQLARELGLLDNGNADGVKAAAAVLPTESGFALAQLRNERVLDARVETRFRIKQLFHERGIRYPAAEVFLRIFKRERSLELWVRSDRGDEFALLKTYAICALAGELGPKRRQGDTQVPEGFYQIDFFNPVSEYHLSLHLDYPNRYDRMSGGPDVNLGGDIFIHGGCNSEGCLALTDDGIKELYWIAVEARAVGQERIPVHIFPARLQEEDLQLMKTAFADRPGIGEFWDSLKPVYDYFEEHRRLPVVTVDAGGAYNVNGTPTGMPIGRAAVSPTDSTRKATVPAPLGRPVGG